MSAATTESKTWCGGCHCGRVAFEVTGAIADISVCNCSICTKKAYLHWIVPRDSFRLLTPIENLSTYTFNTGAAKHHFCPKCGVASFYVARSDPDKVDVNVRCLDGVDLSAFQIRLFDGQNWETALSERNARPGKS
ncbi:MAG: GFA family protein [Candidatus Binataceae bacterium]